VISGRDSSAWLTRHALPVGSVIQIAQPERIRQILDDIIDFGLSDRPNREECCMQAMTYLMVKLSDQIVPLSKSGVRAFHTYQRCRNHIEVNGLTLRSIREVAAACHVDEAYLCRLFQRFGRERPFHYLQHIRMNHAMTLLQTTDRLIKDIAEELHFQDAANFTRAFRAWYGLPPQTIRQGTHAVSP
jgi:AraC-like DNA-binding protein